jgi:hypothetical protein
MNTDIGVVADKTDAVILNKLSISSFQTLQTQFSQPRTPARQRLAPCVYGSV